MPDAVDALPAPAPGGNVVFGHFTVPLRADGKPWELGRGAMGVTYRAFDTSLRTEVALKVIRAEQVADEATRRRFQREARAAAKVRHPNVASVLYLGEQGGEFFYAMEFVAGRSLEALLKEAAGPLPPLVAVALAAQAAAALNAAHKKEVLHRDLKPANLMLLEGDAVDHEDDRTEAAGQRLLKIIDFGLARSFGANRQEDSLVTQTFAGFIGTPAYASPEQASGEQNLDGRSDLYCLGVILWQMLTGRLPFTGRVVEVLGKHQFQPLPFDQLAAANVPAPLVELLRGLLIKDPAARLPQTAAELRATLDRLLRVLAANPDGSGPAGGQPAPEDIERTSDTTTTPAVGTTLVSRYRLGSEVASGDGGRLFLAADNYHGGAAVALKLLPPERLSAEPDFVPQVEAVLEGARRHPHPVLLAHPEGLQHSGGAVFFVREWAEGFPLSDLLRARGALRAAEVFRLLDVLPATLDHAAAVGAFPWLEASLRKLFVTPAGNHAAPVPETGDWPGLHSRPVEEWPDFALRLNPLGFPSASAGADDEVTRVETSHGAAGPVPALARLVRELLGGSPGGLGPIAALKSEGNAVLRRAQDPGAFADATGFWRSLRRASDAPQPLPEPPKVGAAPDRTETVRINVPRLAATLASLPPPESRELRRGRSFAPLAVGTLAALAVLALLVWLWGRGGRQQEPAKQNETTSVRSAEVDEQRERDRIEAQRLEQRRAEESRQRAIQADVARREEADRQATARAREEQERQAAAERAKRPKVINVPGDYPTIQAALDRANGGDTVLVSPGIYNEPLKFTKENVELRGTDRNRVIVRQDAKISNCLAVTDCRSGRISGMTFEHTGSNEAERRVPAVYLYASAIELNDCIVRQGGGHGIYATGRGSDATGPTINGCTIESCGFGGIFVDGDGSRATLRDNTCRKNKGSGIGYERGAGGSAEGNTCEENGFSGIAVLDSGTNVNLVRNTCRKNKLHGMSFDKGASGTAEGNICEDNSDTGISVHDSGSNPSLTGNRCTGNNWGIYKKDGAQPRIARDNVVRGNKHGQIGP